MFVLTLETLNTLQEGRLLELKSSKDRLKLEGGPPTRTSGLYWIYTTYEEADLQAASPAPNRGAVQLQVLATSRQGITNICQRTIDGFRVVYNGIGGIGPKGRGGLRERIFQEFKGGEGTGTLGICNTSVNDLTRWRFSYVLWSEINHIEPLDYASQAASIETLWRLHYGWPLLCAR